MAAAFRLSLRSLSCTVHVPASELLSVFHPERLPPSAQNHPSLLSPITLSCQCVVSLKAAPRRTARPPWDTNLSTVEGLEITTIQHMQQNSQALCQLPSVLCSGPHGPSPEPPAVGAFPMELVIIATVQTSPRFLHQRLTRGILPILSQHVSFVV